MAQFIEIMALRLDNRSYSYVAAAPGCSNRDIAKVQAAIDVTWRRRAARTWTTTVK